MLGELIFILFLGGGFITYRFLSNPQSRFIHSHHLVPYVEIEHVEFLPCLRIPLGKRHIRVHHWIYLGLIALLSLTIDPNLFGKLPFINGFCLGGIIQGITYRDLFKLQDS